MTALSNDPFEVPDGDLACLYNSIERLLDNGLLTSDLLSDLINSSRSKNSPQDRRYVGLFQRLEKLTTEEVENVRHLFIEGDDDLIPMRSVWSP